MLRSRIIPCLLVHDKGLVKTLKFSVENGKYVGDPINAVKIFNEKQVDEIMVIDIDATVEGRDPDYEMIKNVATECRMPLCYGGGVKTVEQVRKIIKLGAEKVAVSSAALDNPDLLRQMSEAVGAQSIVLVLDIMKKKSLFGGTRYELFTHNGKKKTGKRLYDFLEEIKDVPCGELVINNIDLDGVMTGYDLEMCDKVRDLTEVPLTFLGGAGSYEDLKKLVDRYKVIGAAAGSIFIFKGKYKAVLIQYPMPDEKVKIQPI
ncbi:AglZ/HisF2 family acetamidino modification protein [Bacteroides bouchesdurhonensis]|uniref:AglZ/HisF2 family acetamidino modification protein n=1 Tax=Bacteroides bouchesdurhonensis TaxID=1841855 RepID=UPI00097F968C|nr:AglZ/HisF2 family acetamidino modification protein [Bacteroides bouchesdurhonensis]